MGRATVLGGICFQTLMPCRVMALTGGACSVSLFMSSEKAKTPDAHTAAFPVTQFWKVILVCSGSPDKRLQLRFSPCLLINIKVSSLLSKSSDITPKKEAPPVRLESCALSIAPGARWALPSSGVLRSVTLTKINK